MDLLDKHFADNNSKCKSYVVHRLDKSVGGIMVYAKDPSLGFSTTFF